MRGRLLTSKFNLSLRFYLSQIHFAFQKGYCFFGIHRAGVKQTLLCALQGSSPSSWARCLVFPILGPSDSLLYLLLSPPRGSMFLSQPLFYKPGPHSLFYLYLTVLTSCWLFRPVDFSGVLCSHVWQRALCLVMSSFFCTPSDYFCLLAVFKKFHSCKATRGLMRWWSQAGDSCAPVPRGLRHWPSGHWQMLLRPRHPAHWARRKDLVFLLSQHILTAS